MRAAPVHVFVYEGIDNSPLDYRDKVSEDQDLHLALRIIMIQLLIDLPITTVLILQI